MIIDITTSEGNIFYILGVFQKLKKQLEKEGIDTTEYKELLENYKNMNYNEILEEIERITDGVIKFIGVE